MGQLEDATIDCSNFDQIICLLLVQMGVAIKKKWSVGAESVAIDKV
jgi:predicted transporter